MQLASRSGICEVGVMNFNKRCHIITYFQFGHWKLFQNVEYWFNGEGRKLRSASASDFLSLANHNPKI